jgi:thiamine biosynthesis lipoprotein
MTKHKKIILIFSAVLLLLAAAIVFLWVKFGQRAKRYQCTNYAMGTYIQQTVYGKKASTAAAAAAQSIGTLEDLISWRADGSDTARLNQAAGTDWITVNAETAKLLQTSLKVAADSDGAFDPTILPISSLWDFGGNNQHVPAKSDILKYLQYVNYKNLRVNTADSTASLRNHGMGIDLDIIGKGAACDEAAAAYKSSGADCGIIAVGTSVGTYGNKADGSAWSVAVRDPTSTTDNAAAMGEINLSSGFVSTSGTFEKSFRKNGILYHSLLNPKTGFPQNNGLASVTVVSKSGALSDALANACFVLGRQKSALLLQNYGAGAVFTDSAKRVYVTENLKRKFTITNSKFVLQS